MEIDIDAALGKFNEVSRARLKERDWGPEVRIGLVDLSMTPIFEVIASKNEQGTYDLGERRPVLGGNLVRRPPYRVQFTVKAEKNPIVFDFPDSASRVAKTYTIRLCRDGVKLGDLPNVVEDSWPRPQKGDVLEGKWKVIGVRKETTRELHIVDVEEVAP